MWSWLPYPPTPPMPSGAMPLVSRLAISKGEAMHAWESVWRMGIDAGRTEGAAVVVGVVLVVALLALLGGVAAKVTGAVIGRLFK